MTRVSCATTLLACLAVGAIATPASALALKPFHAGSSMMHAAARRRQRQRARGRSHSRGRTASSSSSQSRHGVVPTVHQGFGQLPRGMPPPFAPGDAHETFYATRDRTRKAEEAEAERRRSEEQDDEPVSLPEVQSDEQIQEEGGPRGEEFSFRPPRRQGESRGAYWQRLCLVNEIDADPDRTELQRQEKTQPMSKKTIAIALFALVTSLAGVWGPHLAGLWGDASSNSSSIENANGTPPGIVAPPPTYQVDQEKLGGMIKCTPNGVCHDTLEAQDATIPASSADAPLSLYEH